MDESFRSALAETHRAGSAGFRSKRLPLSVASAYREQSLDGTPRKLMDSARNPACPGLEAEDEQSGQDAGCGMLTAGTSSTAGALNPA